MAVARFNSAADAVAYAKAIIEISLDTLHERGFIAGPLYAEWIVQGEGARIVGVPSLPFNCEEYARFLAFNCETFLRRSRQRLRA